jgi:polyhydroxyalkanoate synthesis regulator phasin
MADSARKDDGGTGPAHGANNGTPAGPTTTVAPQGAAEETPRQKTLREAWLATLGSLGSAEEETQALLGRLVALGTLTREDGARMYGDVRALVEQRRNEVEDKVQKAISAAMKRLTVPTQEDLAEVAQKLAELERRVEALDDMDPPSKSSNTAVPVSTLARALERAQPRKKKG